ncbi:MAG: hypothetical protein JNM32_02655 [Dechloromonas sp.]|nr:hypothetical protein [Dechloromonas sp.]
MKFPFDATAAEIHADPDAYVDAVFGALHSEFLTLPKGEGFIGYPVFLEGYEALRQVTKGFRELDEAAIVGVVCERPVVLVVLRAMLGFTPPEWAYVTSQRCGVTVTQGAARTLDRKARLEPLKPWIKFAGSSRTRLAAMVEAACQLLVEGPEQAPGLIHRLDKADTQQGFGSVRPLAELGVPYAMLLYERFLGRPFAGHRDSVSELVGDVVEAAIEAVLSQAGIPFRKTKRAERINGFDQAPDFVIPDEFSPQVVIEAKLSEDDGTARDKVTRVQHLCSLSIEGLSQGQAPRFEVIACIAGRGFKVRREDMRKLILATQGKVFTLDNLERLVACTRLREFRTR